MSQALAQEFKARYLDSEGLGKLQDEAEENLSRVRNENGILFAAMGWAFFRDYITVQDWDRMHAAIKRLEVVPGLYHRQAGRDTRTEAHDNMTGIVALSILFDFSFPKDICTYGDAHGWSFTNTEPEGFSWSQLRQGGDIAYYKIAAGWVPYPLEMAWLVGGLIYSMLFSNSSSKNLAWLKLRTLPLAIANKTEARWEWVKSMVRFVVRTCQLIDKWKRVFPKSFLYYYGDRHVIFRAALIEYGE